MSTTATPDLAQDQRIESWLTRLGAEFSFEKVRISEIDVAKSHRNQARLGQPIDGETSSGYKVAMERGDVFPAIVVFRSGQKLVVIDGNHRVDGYIATGTKTTSAYLVTNPSVSLVQALTYTANIKHGKPTTDEERQIQAVDLLQSGRDQEWVAEALQLSISAVKNAWLLHKADERAHKLSVSARRWRQLPKSSRLRIGSVLTEEGFVDMARFALNSGAHTNEIGDLVTQMNRIRSAQGQKRFVSELAAQDDWKKRAASSQNGNRKQRTTTGRRILPAHERFLRKLAAVERELRLHSETISRSANLTAGKELTQQCQQVIDGLTTLVSRTGTTSRTRTKARASA